MYKEEEILDPLVGFNILQRITGNKMAFYFDSAKRGLLSLLNCEKIDDINEAAEQIKQLNSKNY
jgi:hypothetical protein